MAELIPGPLDIPRKTVPSQSSAMERVSEAILQTCKVDGIAVTRDASMGVPVDGESRSVFTPRSAFVGRPDDQRRITNRRWHSSSTRAPRKICSSLCHCQVSVKVDKVRTDLEEQRRTGNDAGAFDRRWDLCGPHLHHWSNRERGIVRAVRVRPTCAGS